MEINWFKNVIEKLNINLSFKKINSPGYYTKSKNKITINNGLTYTEAKNLIDSVVNQRFVEFKYEAESKYNERISKFLLKLKWQIDGLPENEILKLKEPDTQLTIIDAAKISGRKNEIELSELLAILVIKRLKNDTNGNEDLKNIILNEAILTINKLTINQIKIITLTLLLGNLENGKINTWDSLNEYLNTSIYPFTNFNNNDIEFQHIVYSGCGSIGFGGPNLIDNFHSAYRNLFIDIDKSEYKDLFDENVGALFREEFIVRDMIIKKTERGEKIINVYEKSSLRGLELTSVGIAIGACFYEQIVGKKLNINLWINK